MREALVASRRASPDSQVRAADPFILSYFLHDKKTYYQKEKERPSTEFGAGKKNRQEATGSARDGEAEPRELDEAPVSRSQAGCRKEKGRAHRRA